jgi:hypothetical protein
MTKILDIYREYKIMPNLQLHQLRVASVAWQICDNLLIKVEKKSIITACLLHDMGNIVKFDLNHFPEYNKPEGIDYWQKVKNDYISRYGEDEHIVSYKIAQELKLLENILNLIIKTDPHVVFEVKNCDDIAEKICIYADQRVTPHKIVSVLERNNEAQERYKNHPHAFDGECSNFFLENMKDIENQIFSHSRIKPEDINDESVKDYINKLKDFEI